MYSKNSKNNNKNNKKDVRHLRKCKFCHQILERNDIGKLVCVDKICLQRKKEKDLKKQEKKENSLTERIFNNLGKKTLKKRLSNTCSRCKQKVRKNYPFGKSSKVRVVGHLKDCEFNR